MQALLGRVYEGTIDYHLYRDAGDFDRSSPCREGRGGCARGSSLFVAYPPVGEATSDRLHEHELIHGYLAGAGTPPTLLVEGIAEAISCSSSVLAADRGLLSWTDAVATSSPSMSTAGYVSSRLFAYEMLRRFGPAPFLDFYGRAVDTKSPALFALQFERELGIAVDDVWAAALAEQGAATICPCAAEPIAMDGAQISIPAACTNRQRVIDVDAEDAVLISSSTNVFASRCDGAAPRPPSGFVGAGSGRGIQIVARLAAGRHNLDIGPGDAVSLSAVGGLWIATDCNLATAIRVDGANAVDVAVPASGDTWFVAITAQVPVIAQQRKTDMKDGTAFLCASCGTSASACQPVSDVGTSLTVGQSSVLRIDTTLAALGRADGFQLVTLTPSP